MASIVGWKSAALAIVFTILALYLWEYQVKPRMPA